MCCCGKPTINGEPNAYSWDGKHFSTREPNPPDLQEGDTLLCDEPGRCGGVDSHSHHFRVVKARYGGVYLLVRHGGGDERLPFGFERRGGHGIVDVLTTLDSNGRYWLLQSIYHMQETIARTAKDAVAAEWRKAAAEKRIQTRKYPARGTIKVWIEPSTESAA